MKPIHYSNILDLTSCSYSVPRPSKLPWCFQLPCLIRYCGIAVCYHFLPNDLDSSKENESGILHILFICLSLSLKISLNIESGYTSLSLRFKHAERVTLIHQLGASVPVAEVHL